jgi:formate hydrogenlyase transcriptional activator
VVAATHQDLNAMVVDGRFRIDLYYRVNVFPIALPPLRERLTDIPLLVAHFAQIFAGRMSKQISKIGKGAMDALIRYPWPGNIRELQNLIERAVILSKDAVLQLPPLPVAKREGEEQEQQPVTLRESERAHILKALRESNWVVGGAFGAAARLGLKRTTLLDRMRRHGISREGARAPFVV